MHETLNIAKDIFAFANLIMMLLIIPLYRFIKNSIQTNIELANTIKELKDEISLLRGILFEIADGEVIKKHLASRKNK